MTLDELVDVSDWSKLEVVLEKASVTSWTRRTNTLYFKGIAEGETQVTIKFDGTVYRDFKLVVSA